MFEGRGTFAPLKLPGFRRLALAYTVNELGNWLGDIALAVLVFDQTHSALATAALFLGTRFLPAFLAPALVARVEPIRTPVSLPLIYGAEAITFVALAGVAGSFSLAAVIALATVDGALALAGRALVRSSTVALLQPSGSLRSGNAILNFGFTGAGAVGPAAGGLIVAGFGVQAALLLDAGSFLFVAVVLAMARSLPRAREDARPWKERLRDGLAYVSNRPVLRRMLGAQALALVFFASVIPIEVVYVKHTLGGGDAGYGALLASWGVGMVAGSVIFATVREMSLERLLFVSAIAVGVAYLALAAAPSLLAACLASALGGLGNGVLWISGVSVLQELTEDAYQARVMGLFESIAAGMPGLGYVLGGAIAAISSTRVTYLVAGVGGMAVVAVAAPMVRRAAPPTLAETTPAPGDAMPMVEPPR